jgi:hypothetical protein
MAILAHTLFNYWVNNSSQPRFKNPVELPIDLHRSADRASMKHAADGVWSTTLIPDKTRHARIESGHTGSWASVSNESTMRAIELATEY